MSIIGDFPDDDELERMLNPERKAPVYSLQTGARLNGGDSIVRPDNPGAAKKAERIKTRFSCDFGASSAKRWVLKRLIALGEIISIVGAPFAGKSGLIAAMVIAIAQGVDFRGFRIKSAGAVIIFAIERGGLVERRIEAQCLRDGVECGSLPIAVCAGSLDILNPDCVDIIKLKIAETESRYSRKVVAIIIDTQNKAIAAGGGDENTARDQNKAAANLRQLLVDLDHGVAIIQAKHKGKDPSRGSRGSNAQEGDDDVTIGVDDKDGLKIVAVTGANDMPMGALLNFKMEPYSFGVDEDGDPIETWIMSNETFGAGTNSGITKWTKGLNTIHDAIVDALLEHGFAHRPSGDGPEVRAVDVKKVRARHQTRFVSGGDGDRDAAERTAWKRNFNLARDSRLIQGETIAGRELIWLLNKEERQH